MKDDSVIHTFGDGYTFIYDGAATGELRNGVLFPATGSLLF
jgi:hypothetical protein